MYRLNTEIRLTMLCLIGFELYFRWVPLKFNALTCTKQENREGFW